jgi:hypothetical protein
MCSKECDSFGSRSNPERQVAFDHAIVVNEGNFFMALCL